MKLGMSLCWALLAPAVAGCAIDDGAIDAPERRAQSVLRDQGDQMQGDQMQGDQMQGLELRGHRLEGVRLGGDELVAVRVERGELVGERLLEITGTTDSLDPCESSAKGLKRKCGWVSEGVGRCEPQAPVRVGASEAVGLGSCTGDAMLRVCAGTRPCERQPIVPPEDNEGMIGESDGTADSDCPAATVTCPDSGEFNVMSAAYDSDEPYSVSIEVEGAEFPATDVLRGTELVGARLVGEAVEPGSSEVREVDYQIADIELEDPAHDPFGTGHTFLYTLEQWVPDTSSWALACEPDADGRAVAIPFGAMWDQTASRVESDRLLTFGCTTGVIAKCYRWGYRPWVTWDESDPDLMVRMHQACTRMARADYCGSGVSHTKEGTVINVWDTLEPPIQTRGEPPPDMMFEAGWNEGGAVCLSKERWLTIDSRITDQCPERLRPPLAGVDATMCDNPEQAQQYDPDVELFNDSHFNVDLAEE